MFKFKKYMATNSKSLIIVESPSKTKTLKKFLGSDYIIEASVGHIRDLAKKDLGVDIDNDFTPTYIVSEDKSKVVQQLKKITKDVDKIFLATDPDREGEAISWHILETLKPKVPVHRLVFNEITKAAILDSIQNPKEVNMDLVRAQESRRILDRLFGFLVSKILWSNVKGKLSAGRVQSPAIKIIIDKERQRLKFIENQYYSITANLKVDKNEFESKLISANEKSIANGNDFNKKTGELKSKDLIHLNQDTASEYINKLDNNAWVVSDIIEKPYTKSPPAPFITSTLQQAGISKLRVGAQRVMSIAQKLYENGYITYMRTDSINLSNEAINGARMEIENLYGKEYLPEKPIQYKGKVKNAQEAHEAVRPAGSNFIHPDKLKSKLEEQEYKLYKLIWSRTIACQMQSAKLLTTQVKIKNNDFMFSAKGKTIQFDGFLKVYQDEAKDGDNVILPKLQKGQKLDFLNAEAKEHTTKPTPRYTEASLVKELEALGIGRPSTYASIISTIINRGYVTRNKGTLIPTFTGFAVVKFLEKYFDQLINLQFTAEMEDELDAISRSDKNHLEFLKLFYNGSKNQKGLNQLLDQEFDKLESKNIMILNEKNKDDIILKIGRYGIYLERGDEKANIPEEFGPENISYQIADKMLELQSKEDECVGKLDGEEIFIKTGRFGSYLKCGDKTKGFPPNITPDNLTEDIAIQIMSLPKNLGKNDEDNSDVQVDIGKFGPYIRSGKKTKSIPTSEDLFNLSLEQAIEILKSKQSSGKVLGIDSKTKKEIELKRGRYGFYVTDGKINVSIKNGEDTTITLEDAIDRINIKASKSK
ncbi:MAG: DNA topoisomerase I [Candidatus Marinimicrobia bacterium]|nr:DNA topoisomerase I [Candidatus Neomarinimicrobiota bacterium]